MAWKGLLSAQIHKVVEPDVNSIYLTVIINPKEHESEATS